MFAIWGSGEGGNGVMWEREGLTLFIPIRQNYSYVLNSTLSRLDPPFFLNVNNNKFLARLTFIIIVYILKKGRI